MKIQRNVWVLAGVTALAVIASGTAAAAMQGLAPASQPATVSHTTPLDGGMDPAAKQGAGDMAAGGAAQTDARHRHTRVLLKAVNGTTTAQVDIDATGNGGNRIDIRAWNLSPGFHAIHIHAAGRCDPAGAKPFTSAGGHFNPTGKAEGMQAGAFPVLLAGADGKATTSFIDSHFTVSALFVPTGSSIVIHAAPDNYANVPNRYSAAGAAGPDSETQMTGDAGARIACGVISPATTAATTPMPMPMPSKPITFGDQNSHF
jgi:superoxide dismutase, Cu-Zn family